MNEYEIIGLISILLFILLFVIDCFLASRWRIEKVLKRGGKTQYLFFSIFIASIIMLAVYTGVCLYVIKDKNVLSQLFLSLSLLFFESSWLVLLGKRKREIVFFFFCILMSVSSLHVSISFPNSEPASKFLINVFGNTFQTFSLDYDYEGFLVPMSCNLSENIKNIFAIILTIVAPITGGFLILDLLCNIFPIFKLNLFRWKRNYYIFSELNEYTIETAESLIKEKYSNLKEFTSILLIFTDVYIDNELESSSELLSRAKAIRAICLKDDITDIKLFKHVFLWKRKKKNIKVFLFDKKEQDNLKTAITLLSVTESADVRKRNYFQQNNTDFEFYILTQNKEAPEIIESARKKFQSTLKDYKYSNPKVLCKIINEYRNLIYRLVDGYDSSSQEENSYPLYLGLDEEASTLNVLVVGSGKIGIEFIKTVYWCGQMLLLKPNASESQPVDINIKVMSKEAESINEKLNFDMPELNQNIFSFISCIFGTNCFREEFSKLFPDFMPNYVLVALGDDNLNLEAAKWIKRELIKKCPEKLIPINFVIEDKNLCSILELNEKTEKNCPILNAFGSLKSRYCIQNILMSDLEIRAWNVDIVHGTDFLNKTEFLNNHYRLQSSIATVLHYPYKVFSFDRSIKRLNENEVNIIKKHENINLVNEIIKLEHKRWIAYLTTIGYSCPKADEFASYAKIDNGKIEASNDKFKWHACMLETNKGNVDFPEYLKKFNTALSECAINREQLLKQMKSNEAKFLNVWLNDNVLPDCKDIDALDRVGLLCNKNFKAYDIEISQSISKDDCRRKILEYLSSYPSNSENFQFFICKFKNLFDEQIGLNGTKISAILIAKCGKYEIGLTENNGLSLKDNLKSSIDINRLKNARKLKNNYIVIGDYLIFIRESNSKLKLERKFFGLSYLK